MNTTLGITPRTVAGLDGQVSVLTFQLFADMYLERQESTMQALHETLAQQIRRFCPDGWMLLECVDMSSSRFGELVILPYGPNNTWKGVPPADKPVSPRGLASDMSMVRAVMTREIFQKFDDETGHVVVL